MLILTTTTLNLLKFSLKFASLVPSVCQSILESDLKIGMFDWSIVGTLRYRRGLIVGAG
jgi:hypothetical protein